jgi:hypothetical protein
MCSTHCVLWSTSAVFSLESTIGAVGGRSCRGDHFADQRPTFESKRRSLAVKDLAVVQDAVDEGSGQTRILDDGLGSSRGAVSAFRLIRFPSPPRRTGLACHHASGSPQIHANGLGDGPRLALIQGLAMRSPRYW